MNSLLAKSPTEFNGVGVFIRLIDSIQLRYTLAVTELREEDKNFRATPESMSMLELQKHISALIMWSAKSVGATLESTTIPETFDERVIYINELCRQLKDHLLTMDDEALSKVSIYLKRADTHYSVWYLINGPLSDAIHHIGQMVSWRRISGNPVPRLSPFTGTSY